MIEEKVVDHEVKMLIASQLELNKMISHLMSIYGGKEPQSITNLANNLITCLEELNKIIMDKITQ